MKTLYALTLAVMLSLSTGAFSQSYTFQGAANLPVTAKAGDIVTVTAALSTNDIDEDGEGEPLIVSLPGGSFTVSNYFANQTTHFVALIDNPVVFAQIPGADGDETARVTFSVRKMRFTQEEKDHFARVALALGATSLGLTTVGGACETCAGTAGYQDLRHRRPGRRSDYRRRRFVLPDLSARSE